MRQAQVPSKVQQPLRAQSCFDDLSLRFELTPQGDEITVRIDSSPMGSSQAVPFLVPSLPAWNGDFYVAEGEAQRFGDVLFRSLFTGEARERLLTCLARLEAQPQLGLRLRLKMVPEVVGLLADIPWELLYRAETRDFLSLNVRTPVVRHLEVQRAMPSRRQVERLRLLVVLSSPRDMDPLDLELERQRIEVGVGCVPGIELNFLAGATLGSLRQRVRDEPFDVMHFVGHGTCHGQSAGAVLFEDATGRSVAVSGEVLAENLKGFEELRLVVLNACESANTPSLDAGGDPFRGVASALLMAGAPAVVAMQRPISDEAAVTFSHAFYDGLGRGDGLENAVTEGRLAVFSSPSVSWEWSTPVLFLGCPNGRLFVPWAESRVSTEPLPVVAEDTGQSPQDGIATALELMDYRRYDEAQRVLQGLSQEQPSRAEIWFYLALSRLQGKRPRSLRPNEIRQLEADLWQAHHLYRGEEPAHLWLFAALIKHDFYRLNGLRVISPSVDEVLLEADSAGKDEMALRYLSEHVPTPQNKVRQRLSVYLGGL